MKVYYGFSIYFEEPYLSNNQKIFNLVKKPLQPLGKFLRDTSTPGNLQICNAFKEDWSNTYIDHCPIDISTSFLEDGKIEFDNTKIMVSERIPGAFKNRISFDLSYCYLFFTEEDLVLSVLPPIFHKNTISESAVLTSGSYNIGKWFRPIHPSFHLWENIKNIDIRENDPIMYFQFRTNEKIEFIEFEVTDKIWQYSRACSVHARLKPFRSLADRYLDFSSSGFKKQILKEIKNNLI